MTPIHEATKRKETGLFIEGLIRMRLNAIPPRLTVYPRNDTWQEAVMYTTGTNTVWPTTYNGTFTVRRTRVEDL